MWYPKKTIGDNIGRGLCKNSPIHEPNSGKFRPQKASFLSRLSDFSTIELAAPESVRDRQNRAPNGSQIDYTGIPQGSGRVYPGRAELGRNAEGVLIWLTQSLEFFACET